jgi:uncharacterized protein RhaS with RHS repeats
MYDPTIGQWLSEDPTEFDAGDPNLRRMVGNNVINMIDPNGLKATITFSQGKFSNEVSVDRLPMNPRGHAVRDDSSLRKRRIYGETRMSHVISLEYRCDSAKGNKPWTYDIDISLLTTIAMDKDFILQEQKRNAKDTNGRLVTIESVYGHEQSHVLSLQKEYFHFIRDYYHPVEDSWYSSKEEAAKAAKMDYVNLEQGFALIDSEEAGHRNIGSPAEGEQQTPIGMVPKF